MVVQISVITVLGFTQFKNFVNMAQATAVAAVPIRKEPMNMWNGA
jgi:hypothetical protein